MVKFIESTYQQNQHYLDQYLKNLSYHLDSFQEDHILDSKVFSIFLDDRHQGYFAVCENVFDIEGFTVLTQFILDSDSLKHSQPIFKQVLEDHGIVSAFISSKDELFLSISMDFHKSVTMQAYMHTDGNAPIKAAEFPRTCMVLANDDDFPEIQRLSNNYFDFLLHPRKRDKFQLYILKDKETILGFGLLEEGEMVKNINSLGIYTIEEHRKKGVGRSMMIHLKNICYEKGIKPLTGCNWYNKKSKATIESAGFISQTRLFKIEFTEDKKWVSI